jgi:hypothetical protein
MRKYLKIKFYLILLLCFIISFNFLNVLFAQNGNASKKNIIINNKIDVLKIYDFMQFDNTNCITHHGEAPIYIIKKHLQARITRPDKIYSNWILLNDKFNSQKFYGSFSIKPIGTDGVSSMKIKLRGADPNDLQVFSYKPGKINSGEFICSLKTDNLSCDVYVHPESYTGKTLAIKLRGKIITK